MEIKLYTSNHDNNIRIIIAKKLQVKVPQNYLYSKTATMFYELDEKYGEYVEDTTLMCGSGNSTDEVDVAVIFKNNAPIKIIDGIAEDVEEHLCNIESNILELLQIVKDNL